MPGAAAGGGGGSIYPGVQGVASAGRATIANQTAGFAPLITGGGGGVVSAASAASGLGYNPLYLLMGVQALGTAATSYSQSKAQMAEGDYQASIYESNARIQAIKAADAIVRGEKEAVKAKQLAKAIIGSQRAATGAQGLDPNQDDSLLLQEDTAMLGAEEALNIRNSAWREAWGYRVAENDLYGKAKYAKLTAKNTSRNTILTGGLSIAKSMAYAQYLDKNRSALYGYGATGIGDVS